MDTIIFMEVFLKDIKKDNKRGFTLLLAVVVASLMLILAGSMFNLVQKEIILASLGRDSQYAFYTADSALECALYWDFVHEAFTDPDGGQVISCGDATIGSIVYPGVGIAMEYTYDEGGRCVRVAVVKRNSYPRTTIEARGYNASCANLVDNSRALERAVQTTY